VISYELSAKARILQIASDIMSMFPPKNWLEREAVSQFEARLNSLTEDQCREILGRVLSRLKSQSGS
jgi:hypothetical protein